MKFADAKVDSSCASFFDNYYHWDPLYLNITLTKWELFPFPIKNFSWLVKVGTSLVIFISFSVFNVELS